ncbi:hypothetical protein BKA70DRAFT_1307163, partial [Coprinopsis sp. MPI-PUGE-AT-0042]
MRSIPPELLGLVFGSLFGDAPFGASEYRQFACISSVCSTWREAAHTTPNLCKGLSIDPSEWRGHSSMEEVRGQEQEQEQLVSLQASWKPWLTIVSRSSTYHLELSTFYDASCNEAFVRYLLTSSPTPDTLTFDSRRALRFALKCQRKHQRVHRLTLTKLVHATQVSLLPLPTKFPNLRTLTADYPVDTTHHPPLRFDHLRTLHMKDLCANPLSFNAFLGDFPSLRELKISSLRYIPGAIDTTENLIPPLPHTSLETLIIHGDDMLHYIAATTFPALRFFCIRSWGMQDAATTFKNALPSLFRDSRLQPLTVSLQGRPYATFLSLITQSAPNYTRLHLDIDCISCQKAGDLHWLPWDGDGPSRRSGNPLKIKTGIEARKRRLEMLGYDLAIWGEEDLTGRLHSSLPPIEYQWESK